MTLKDTASVISSPGLAGGRSPCASPDGPMTDLFGQDLAPANHSPSPARKRDSTTKGTYGPTGNGLSPSDALQQSLENRLRVRLRGSPWCAVIWKPWNTPWGQCLSKPRARTQTISEIDIGLWPTMTSNTPARNGNNEAGNSAGQVAIRRIILALWSTLRASDGAKGSPRQSYSGGGSPLPSQVFSAASSLNAPTENGGGSLHPEFAGWEMGYLPAWLNCAPLETRSTRGRRRNSSKPQSKRSRKDETP